MLIRPYIIELWHPAEWLLAPDFATFFTFTGFSLIDLPESLLSSIVLLLNDSASFRAACRSGRAAANQAVKRIEVRPVLPHLGFLFQCTMYCNQPCGHPLKKRPFVVVFMHVAALIGHCPLID